MTKTQVPANAMPDIPAALKRETNTKGVTLSGGEIKPAVATAAKKDEPTITKVPAGKTAKQIAADERKAAKAAEPKVTKSPKTEPTPVVDPDTGNPLPVRRSIVPKRFKAEYKAHGGTCGDDMALELKAATTVLNADKRPSLDWPALRAIAEANGIQTASYEGLNNGQKRMNVGNKLRGMLADGKDVRIGKRTFKAEDWEPREPRKPVQQAQAN